MSDLRGSAHPKATSCKPALSPHSPAAELMHKCSEWKCAASGNKLACSFLLLLEFAPVPHSGMSEVWLGMCFDDFLPSVLLHIS